MFRVPLNSHAGTSEWEKTSSRALGIPKDRAADLLKEVDQNGDGQVRGPVLSLH